MRGLLLDAVPLDQSLLNAVHLVRRVLKHAVHLLRERVRFTQVLYRRVSSFLVGVQRSVVLLQELVLDSDVVQRYYKDSVSSFGRA